MKYLANASYDVKRIIFWLIVLEMWRYGACIGSVLVRQWIAMAGKMWWSKLLISWARNQREKTRPGSHIPLQRHFSSDLTNFLQDSTALLNIATLATKPLHVDFWGTLSINIAVFIVKKTLSIWNQCSVFSLLNTFNFGTSIRRMERNT